MIPEGFRCTPNFWGCTQLVCGIISQKTRLDLLSLLKRLSWQCVLHFCLRTDHHNFTCLHLSVKLTLSSYEVQTIGFLKNDLQSLWLRNCIPIERLTQTKDNIPLVCSRDLSRYTVLSRSAPELPRCTDDRCVPVCRCRHLLPNLLFNFSPPYSLSNAWRGKLLPDIREWSS